MALISEEYRALNRGLHQIKENWGLAARGHAPAIEEFAKRCGFTEILDYGCGKERLRSLLEPKGIKVRGYDPAMPGLDEIPEPAEFVVCLDVLEHVEPHYLADVLKDLHRVTLRTGIFSISTRPASTLLPDGSNAHRIIENEAWWLHRLQAHFKWQVLQSDPPIQFIVLVNPL